MTRQAFVKFSALTLLAFSSFVSVTGTAQAITLDEFDGDGLVSSSVPAAGASAATISTSAVGGVRSLYSEKQSVGAGVTRLESFPDPEFSGDSDYSLGYTQGAHSGQGIVSWDGDTNSNFLVTSGLPSINLSQDGGTAFLLGVKFFDYPSNQPFDLTLRLFDSSDASGTKFSDVTVTLDKSLHFTTVAFPLTIPFSRFQSAGADTVAAPGGTFNTKTTFGSGGPANLNKLGAMQLILNGLTNSNAPDLVIDYLSTNGRCRSVPNAEGLSMDNCGVCLEDPNANKGVDMCGVCLFGAPGYSYTSVVDECGLCPGAPNYKTSKDICGICGGSGKVPSDCVKAASCQTVAAPKEILTFEKRLLQKAQLMVDRFKDEAKRNSKNKCGVRTSLTTRIVNSAFNTIKSSGRSIFAKGVQVCGDSCVTVSYSAQVSALNPQFKIMEKETVLLANKVKSCFARKGIKSTVKTRGVAQTVSEVKSGLQQLIIDCQSKQVCPTH